MNELSTFLGNVTFFLAVAVVVDVFADIKTNPTKLKCLNVYRNKEGKNTLTSQKIDWLDSNLMKN